MHQCNSFFEASQTELPLPPRVEIHQKGRIMYFSVQEWRREPTKKRTIRIKQFGSPNNIIQIRLTLPPIVFLLNQNIWSNADENQNQNTHSNFQLHAFVEKIHNGVRYLTGLPLPHVRINGEVCLLPDFNTKLEDLLVIFWGSEFMEEDYIMCTSGSADIRAMEWRGKLFEWEKGPEHLTFENWFTPRTNSMGFYEIRQVTPPFSFFIENKMKNNMA